MKALAEYQACLGGWGYHSLKADYSGHAKSITVRIDYGVASAVQHFVAKRDLTADALVGEYLTNLAGFENRAACPQGEPKAN